MRPQIYFFNEGITFNALPSRTILKKWLSLIAQNESFKIEGLNYIFCSDDYLLSINQQFLNHNTLTDIITFDNSTEDHQIVGDIYISIERVKENAILFNVDFTEELKRVMVHGLLHLCGFKDKTKAQKAEMRVKENMALQLWITAIS